MYDPYAPQMTPPLMQAIGAPVMTATPIPGTPAPNNALATMFPGHRGYPTGEMNPTPYGGPNGRFPINPGANGGGPMHQGGFAQGGGFMNLPGVQAWFANHPDFQAGMYNRSGPNQWRQELADWRSQRPVAAPGQTTPDLMSAYTDWRAQRPTRATTPTGL